MYKSLKFGKFLTLRTSMGISKKGQGLSLNVIIIAAIALLVLVVLSVVFLGKTGLFVKETDSCTNKGGRCADPGVGCGTQGTSVENYQTVYTAWKCPNEGEVCCIKIASE